VLALCAALAAAGGCTIRARPEPTTTTRAAAAAPLAATTTTLGAATRGTTVATRAFTLFRTWPGGGIRPGRAEPLPLAMRKVTGPTADQMVNLLLVFPLLETPARCVRKVELWLRVLRFDQQFRYGDPEIGAYPSSLMSLASARPATRAGYDTLIDNRPVGAGVRTPDDAWMHFDLTELYRTWAEGGPFPSQERTIPKGTPLVVDVRATDFGQQLFEARIAPLADPETAPHLRWVAARDCPTTG
jgi:hypothetical protein